MCLVLLQIHKDLTIRYQSHHPSQINKRFDHLEDHQYCFQRNTRYQFLLLLILWVWMDYVWLIGAAYFAKRGTDVMNLKWYKPLMAIFGFILIYLGITFIIPIII